MIPRWKTEEKDKKFQKIGKNGVKIEFTYPLTDPDFEFSQGNNSEQMN